MLTTVEGVYRNGKIELIELPHNLHEDTPVIVTFLSGRLIDLQAREISEVEAAEVRTHLLTFAEEWNSPEMELYDDYDQVKASL
jgi:hypothetical protein